MLQQYPLFPAYLRPPVPATNEAALGYAFDASTSPAAPVADPGARRAARGQRGSAALEGRGVSRRSDGLDRGSLSEPGNAIEWYFPESSRSTCDGANLLSKNPSQRSTPDCGEFHRAQVDVPLGTRSRPGLPHGARAARARGAS